MCGTTAMQCPYPAPEPAPSIPLARRGDARGPCIQRAPRRSLTSAGQSRAAAGPRSIPALCCHFSFFSTNQLSAYSAANCRTVRPLPWWGWQHPVSPDGLQPTRRWVLCSRPGESWPRRLHFSPKYIGEVPAESPSAVCRRLVKSCSRRTPPASFASLPAPGAACTAPSCPHPSSFTPSPAHTGSCSLTPLHLPVPQNLLHAGGEPLRQPLAPHGSSRGAEPLLRELVPGMPRLPGGAALHHLAAAAQRDHEHHAGAVRQRAGRSRPAPCPRRRCCRPRSDRFVPQEKKVGGKWQFQCQHGSEECLGNMIQVSRAASPSSSRCCEHCRGVLTAPPSLFPSPQACLMHEAENFTTYFPVIFCMESGTSATKNLEAVRPRPRPPDTTGSPPPC